MSLILRAVIIAVFSQALGQQLVPNRRYLPEENDPARTKYILYQDDDNITHVEDLTEAVPITKVSHSDVTLYLYTQKNSANGVQLQIDSIDHLKLVDIYNPDKENVFIIHGWRNHHKSKFCTSTTNAILKEHDVNVFVVDWEKHAKKFYTTSKKSVPIIGAFIGSFIKYMAFYYMLPFTNFKLIGHSLGAHIAGCVGASVDGKIDYIIGLDPAGPLFSLNNKDNRLDESDAFFVHVVHTSGSLLGFGSSIGHADYFPNNGNKQPGCGIDIMGTCAHSRSYLYYVESIVNGGFQSIQCNSYNDFKLGLCVNNQQSALGSFNVDKSAFGDYYLNTNKKAPFSLN